ncbi:MAG: hypothetical protein J6W64_08545, partial [Bacilli bacterium]|nr:hypothetical protein [Bacilli bacterium]
MGEEILTQGNMEGLQQQAPESRAELEVQVPQENAQNSELESKTDKKPAKEFTIKQIIKGSDLSRIKRLKVAIIIDSIGIALETLIAMNGLRIGINLMKKYNYRSFAIVAAVIGVIFPTLLAIYVAHSAHKEKKEIASINASLNEQQILRVGERMEGLSLDESDYKQISEAIHEHSFEKASALLDKLEMEQSSNELNETEREKLEK